MSGHRNRGYNIKNLRGTSGCPHYRGLQCPTGNDTKCSVNRCSKTATGACHVISSNQSAATGTRKIVYMCGTHNKLYRIHNIRSNALTYPLPDCKCGFD